MAADAYTFALSDRWTKPSTNVLPPEVMAQIKPIAEAPAPAGLTSYGDFEEGYFDGIRTASADVSLQEGTDWLRQLPVALSEQVTVRWDTTTAIQTTWEIFSQYWDEFCYPTVDDVEVFPESGAWLLLYHHWELFEWGRRATPPRASDR